MYFFKFAQAGGQTRDLFIFAYFLSQLQRLRTLGYFAPFYSNFFSLLPCVSVYVGAKKKRAARNKQLLIEEPPLVIFQLRKIYSPIFGPAVLLLSTRWY